MNRDFIVQNIQYYLQLLWRQKIYFLIPSLAIMVIGSILVFSQPRSYYAEALLIVEGQQIPSTLVPATVTNERLQLLEQRVLARDSLIDLAQRYDLYPALRGVVSNDVIASQVRLGITFTAVTPEGMDATAASSIVHVGFKYSDPNVAAAVTSGLVDMLMNETKRLRVSRATETAQFLTREANDIEAKLREKETFRDRFVEENKDSMPSRIPQLNTELQEKERDLSALETVIASQNEDVSLLEAQLRLGVENSADAGRRRAQLDQLQNQMDEARLIYSDSHPQIRALRQKIDLLTAQAASAATADSTAATTAVPANLTPDLALISQRITIAKSRQTSLLQQRDQMRARITTLKTAIGRGPDIEAQVSAIETERASLQRSLDDMKVKLETARIGERLENDQSAMQIQVIETPVVPQYPTQSRKLFLMVVIGLALAAGAAAAVASDILTPTIRGTFDLAEALRGQTLVVIPEWSPTDATHESLPARVGAIFRRMFAGISFGKKSTA